MIKIFSVQPSAAKALGEAIQRNLDKQVEPVQCWQIKVSREIRDNSEKPRKQWEIKTEELEFTQCVLAALALPATKIA